MGEFAERCPKCNSLVLHPRVYYYECANPHCSYSYVFDPSDPKIGGYK